MLNLPDRRSISSGIQHRFNLVCKRSWIRKTARKYWILETLQIKKANFVRFVNYCVEFNFSLKCLLHFPPFSSSNGFLQLTNLLISLSFFLFILLDHSLFFLLRSPLISTTFFLTLQLSFSLNSSFCCFNFPMFITFSFTVCTPIPLL